MENLSHSVSKKAYNGHGFGDKAVYDDVFGGPPKFGVPTLSPRVEDYAEIFGSFHASRASSIPILDLPVVDESDFPFDVRSSQFDYTDVFGGFNALDFAVSFEELFNQSKTIYDSSDEAWTPAQREYLSDESDPSACSERSQSLLNGGSYWSGDGIKKVNVSYNKSSQRSKEDMSTGMAHMIDLHAAPGFTFIVNETPPSQKREDRNSPLPVTDDLNLNVDFSGKLRARKQFRKTMSHPANSNFGLQTLGTDPNPVKYGKSASCKNETFVTVSNISLRTQPSQLPPPLRPPPVLTVKDGDSDQQKSKLTTSKSFALGEMAGDSSPPFFDVVVDASSSAAVSVAAMKDAMEKAQAKLRSAKELRERKKEALESRTKWELKNDAKDQKVKASKTIDGSNCFEEVRVHGTYQTDCSPMKTNAGDERQKVMRTTQVVSDSIEGEEHINVPKISADKKHAKDGSSRESDKTERPVAWRHAAQYYEVVETDKSRKVIEQAKDARVFVQNTASHEHGQERKATPSLQQQVDDGGKMKDDIQVRECNVNKGRSKAAKDSSRQENHEKKVKVNQEVCKQEETRRKTTIAEHRISTDTYKSEECENMAEVQQKENQVEVEKVLKEPTERIEDRKSQKDAHDREETERKLGETLEKEKYENKQLKEAIKRTDFDKRPKEALDREEKEKQHREACEREVKEKRQKEAGESAEREKRFEEAREREESEKRLKEVEQEEHRKILEEALELEVTETTLQIALEREENEKRIKFALERDENDKSHEREESEKRANEAREREESEKRLKEAWEQGENTERLQEAHEREESEKSEAFKREELEENSEVATEGGKTQKGVEVTGYLEELKGCSYDHEQNERVENERKLNFDQETHIHTEWGSFNPDGTCKLDGYEDLQSGYSSCKQDIKSVKVKKSLGALSFQEDRTMRTDSVDTEGLVEAVEAVNMQFEEQLESASVAQDDLQYEKKNQIREKDGTESLHLHENGMESVEEGIGLERTHISRNKKAPKISGKPRVLTHELGQRGIDVKEVDVSFDKEETKEKLISQVVKELMENARKTGADQATVLQEKRNAQCTAQKVSTSQNIERKENIRSDILTTEEREKEDRVKREREREKERLRKMEEEREREREREKDRMAVDRATLEARERAFAEARERASVERATAEVRQRAMAEARERLEKASAEARERTLGEKASMEARLRAERAAVERATAEARERAFQKAMAEKATCEAREQFERSVAGKSFASCTSGGLRQTSSFSDLEDVQCQGVGSFSGSIYSYSSVHGGVEGESSQRCKARLERHRRTAERAEKALAEKNMRDLLAQKEQAERNRLAEALDAEVKRWSSGKEGKLRALLSTLQYILGPDSGWQPIPLTEVITSVAVKKAYRKATLCVHPDKLQQRGASIQQKYICEKVFDLLKEAWNKFNSEER